jgi:hypothetical protein
MKKIKAKEIQNKMCCHEKVLKIILLQKFFRFSTKFKFKNKNFVEKLKTFLQDGHFSTI